MSWHVENTTDMSTPFVTSCGEQDTQYFGELLHLPTTTAGGWYGSYANDNPVPSACHCMALCVAHIGEGCRSYKYYNAGGIRHCYLQSNIFSTGEGFWGVPHSKNPNT